MKDYMGLYSQIIKKVTRGGPHRVAGILSIPSTSKYSYPVCLIKQNVNVYI